MKRCVSSTVNLPFISICAVVLLVSCVFAAAQHEGVIYSCGTKAGDGGDPKGGLIADAGGNLYGTTFVGGTGNFGTVYELTSPVSNMPWTETVLYSFTDGEDGANPSGNLVFDSAGNLYGTAGGGGNANCISGGCGAIFELSPPAAPGGNWTETTLYAFTGGSDGIYPNGGVVFDAAGNLYGSTIFGGSDAPQCIGQPVTGCDTVFELSPPTAPGGSWTETILYSFTDGDDGGFPEAPVIVDNAGNVFGTTWQAGCFQFCGTLFELTPSVGGVWTEIVIHVFGNGFNDGASPQLRACS